MSHTFDTTPPSPSSPSPSLPPPPPAPAAPGAADARSPDPARRALRLAYVLRRHDADDGTPELARLLSHYRSQEPA